MWQAQSAREQLETRTSSWSIVQLRTRSHLHPRRWTQSASDGRFVDGSMDGANIYTYSDRTGELRCSPGTCLRSSGRSLRLYAAAAAACRTSGHGHVSHMAPGVAADLSSLRMPTGKQKEAWNTWGPKEGCQHDKVAVGPRNATHHANGQSQWKTSANAPSGSAAPLRLQRPTNIPSAGTQTAIRETRTLSSDVSEGFGEPPLLMMAASVHQERRRGHPAAVTLKVT